MLNSFIPFSLSTNKYISCLLILLSNVTSKQKKSLFHMKLRKLDYRIRIHTNQLTLRSFIYMIHFFFMFRHWKHQMYEKKTGSKTNNKTEKSFEFRFWSEMNFKRELFFRVGNLSFARQTLDFRYHNFYYHSATVEKKPLILTPNSEYF